MRWKIQCLGKHILLFHSDLLWEFLGSRPVAESNGKTHASDQPKRLHSLNMQFQVGSPWKQNNINTGAECVHQLCQLWVSVGWIMTVLFIVMKAQNISKELFSIRKIDVRSVSSVGKPSLTVYSSHGLNFK